MNSFHNKSQGELYHGFALGLPETYAAIMGKLEGLIDEHRAKQGTDDSGDVKGARSSVLRQMVPGVSSFHTPLPLREAWLRYDKKYSVSSRRHVRN